MPQTLPMAQSANDLFVSEAARALVDGYVAAAAAAAAAEGDVDDKGATAATAAAESHLALVRFAVVRPPPAWNQPSQYPGSNAMTHTRSVFKSFYNLHFAFH